MIRRPRSGSEYQRPRVVVVMWVVRGAALLVGAMIVAGLVVVVALNDQYTSIEGDSEPNFGIHDLSILTCTNDGVGFAHAEVGFFSASAYDYVSLVGNYLDAEGLVVGPGVGTEMHVKAGRSYRTEVTYDLPSGQPAGGSCDVHVASAG